MSAPQLFLGLPKEAASMLPGFRRQRLERLLGDTDVDSQFQLASDLLRRCASKGAVWFTFGDAELSLGSRSKRAWYCVLVRLAQSEEEQVRRYALFDGVSVEASRGSEQAKRKYKKRLHEMRRMWCQMLEEVGCSVAPNKIAILLEGAEVWVTPATDVPSGLSTPEQKETGKGLACRNGARLKEVLSGTRVLLVDDDEPFLGHISSHLEYSGCEVFEATNAEDAWRLVLEKEGRLDVALVDLFLRPTPTGPPQRYCGIPLIERISKHWPSISLIGLSSWVPGGQAKLDAPAMTTFVQKQDFAPGNDPELLIELLRDVLGGNDGGR